LPSKEREEFVASERHRGFNFVTERQKNRYIDMFLRFCKKNARQIKPSDLTKYAKHLERQCHTFETARAKIAIPIQWCRWMVKTKKITKDPSLGMSAAALVAKLKKNQTATVATISN